MVNKTRNEFNSAKKLAQEAYDKIRQADTPKQTALEVLVAPLRLMGAAWMTTVGTAKTGADVTKNVWKEIKPLRKETSYKAKNMRFSLEKLAVHLRYGSAAFGRLFMTKELAAETASRCEDLKSKELEVISSEQKQFQKEVLHKRAVSHIKHGAQELKEDGKRTAAAGKEISLGQSQRALGMLNQLIKDGIYKEGLVEDLKEPILNLIIIAGQHDLLEQLVEDNPQIHDEILDLAENSGERIEEINREFEYDKGVKEGFREIRDSLDVALKIAIYGEMRPVAKEIHKLQDRIKSRSSNEQRIEAFTDAFAYLTNKDAPEMTRESDEDQISRFKESLGEILDPETTKDTREAIVESLLRQITGEGERLSEDK